MNKKVKDFQEILIEARNPDKKDNRYNVAAASDLFAAISDTQEDMGDLITERFPTMLNKAEVNVLYQLLEDDTDKRNIMAIEVAGIQSVINTLNDNDRLSVYLDSEEIDIVKELIVNAVEELANSDNEALGLNDIKALDEEPIWLIYGYGEGDNKPTVEGWVIARAVEDAEFLSCTGFDIGITCDYETYGRKWIAFKNKLTSGRS